MLKQKMLNLPKEFPRATFISSPHGVKPAQGGVGFLTRLDFLLKDYGESFLGVMFWGSRDPTSV